MQGKMRPDLYRELYEVEHTHWWHLHKRAVVHQLIKKYANRGKLLDIGCGTSKILEEFRTEGWQVYGVDGEPQAIAWSRKRRIQVKRVDLVKQALPFKKNQFDVVLALDILEHLPNDARVVTEISRVLKPQGILVLTVPSYPWLFGNWDRMLGHQRRYTYTSVKDLIAPSLDLRFLSYYFCLYLIPAIIVRYIKQLAPNSVKRSDFLDTPWAPLTVPVLKLYGYLERAWLSKGGLPFGLSVIAVATKSR